MTDEALWGKSSLEASVPPLELEVVSLDLRQWTLGLPKEESDQFALGVAEQRTLHLPWEILVAILLKSSRTGTLQLRHL